MVHHLFPGSSMVEHSAVNRTVAGSSPALGATFVPDVRTRRALVFLLESFNTEQKILLEDLFT